MALPAFASLDDCYTTSGNIVANCGFENGEYTSNIGGDVNALVPVSWTPNQAFDSEPSFNDVRPPGGGNQPVYQGSHALSIGNFDNQTAPVLSQTLTDTNGVTYNGSIWVDYGGAGGGDSGAFFSVLIGGVQVVSLNYTAPGNPTAPYGTGYTEYTFNFMGTGSDVLALTGNTDPSEWFVDDITINAATPEPTLLFPSGILCAALWYLLRRRGTARNIGI